MEQQIPPDAAPLMTHIKSYWDKSADVARGEGASRTDPGNFDMILWGDGRCNGRILLLNSDERYLANL
jgi:hypothetical protein